MKNRKILSTFLLLAIFMIGNNVELDAQRRGTKKRTRDTDEDTRRSRRNGDDYNVKTWKDNLYYELHLGNIGFGGNQFSVAGKPTVGYHLSSFLSANLGLKGTYLFANNTFGDDVNLFDWGIAPALRVKFLENFYIQGEFSYNSFNTIYDDGTGNYFKRQKWSPYIGGGYLSGVGPNKFGMQLLFVADNEVRDTSLLGDVVEIWFGFYKNF